MGALIDSSVLIAADRGQLDLDAGMAGAADESVAIAAITASELLHSVHRAATAAQRRHREAFVERLLAVLPVLPFDAVAARIHAALWVSLASKGASIGAHDLLIAATAIAAGYRVVTREHRSFARIPGLDVVIV